MRNWKTTLAGIVSILTVVVKLLNGGVANIDTKDLGALSIGVGLIAAKDSNVTGGTVPQ